VIDGITADRNPPGPHRSAARINRPARAAREAALMSQRPTGDEVDLVPGRDFLEVRFRGRYPAGPVLRALAALLPPGLILYLEGTSISPVAAAFLASRAAPDPTPVPRGTIWPRPATFHMFLTTENVESLVELMDHLAAPEVGDHVHAYRGTTAHLIWHDAWFDSPLYLRATVPAEGLDRLCAEFGCTFSPVAF
jgi:hypothetical protein